MAAPAPAAAAPAARRRGPRRPQKVAPSPVVQNNAFVAPVEVPQDIKPEGESLDLGIEGGVAGGVEGGVPGGVVGGVVGGLPDAPPPQQAVRVGGDIKEPKKLKNVKPSYPDIAKQARVQGVVILECTISPQGKVTDVKVLRGIRCSTTPRRGRPPVGVYADPAQWRARSHHHDGDGELQAQLRTETEKVQEDAQWVLT